MITTAVPRRCCRTICRASRVRSVASRPPNGSSRMSSSGSSASALARSRRLCSPNDSSSGYRSATYARPTWSSSSAALARSRAVMRRRVQSTFSRTVSSENVSACWKVRPMPSLRRAVARAFSRGLPPYTALPSTRPPPTSPDRTFSKVVLPAPLGPMIARVSPARTESEAPSSALRPPKATATSSSLSSSAAVAPGAATGCRDSSENSTGVGVCDTGRRTSRRISRPRWSTTPPRRNSSAAMSTTPGGSAAAVPRSRRP